MASINDPGFPGQWWLQAGTGLNLASVWDEYRGRGLRVAVIDTGLAYADPEFAGRIDAAADFDARDGDPDASGPGDDGHGQTVGLLLAAALNDGIGGVGVAPEATLVGVRLAPRGPLRTPAQEIAALERQSSVDIAHNSWSYSGEPFRDDFGSSAYAPALGAIEAAAANGRGGLGTVIVRSAGNSRADGDDIATHNFQNNRYTVAVASVDADGRATWFSNPGAALMVSAPGEATSWSAPLVSGTVALMLEANPGLGWRDVQDILALSARRNDLARDTWTVNGAATWNGGGLWHSRDYGFGIVDPRAAVRLAETWEIVATSANERTVGAAARPSAAIPDGTGASVASALAIAEAIRVDQAEIALDIAHPRPGDLEVRLTSPAGTTALLYDNPMRGGLAGAGIRFATSANTFRDEAGAGTWTLTVTDTAAGQAGVLEGWSLTLAGDAPSENTRYTFTDAFAALAGAGRERIGDAAGVDTLDAAAVTGAATLDLRPGATSMIAGRGVSLADGTPIENAIGGDGGDRVLGNAGANRLLGGRGDDLLRGGAGDDALLGGPGSDRLDGGAGADTAVYKGAQALYAVTTQGRLTTVTGPEGRDELRGVERIAFADAAVSVPPFAAPNDSGGDGLSDLVWRHESGATTLWTMNGADAVGWGFIGTVGPDWTLAATADADGDGRSDLVWRHATGDTTLWLMDGAAAIGWGFLGRIGPDWTLAATGDFNGDGHADLVWRHDSGDATLWVMDGVRLAEWGFLGSVGRDWTVAAAGDFDGDGRDDLVWRHETGVTTLWTMDGAAAVGWGLIRDAAPDWTVAAAGDFDGDGRSDLVWRRANGDTALWLMDGAQVRAQGDLGNVGADWTLAGAGDLDGDGRSDLVWRHATGATTLWTMDGVHPAGWAFVASVPPDWTLVV